MSDATIFGVAASMWWLSGAVSFVYWWTKEHDFTSGLLVTCAIAGLVGPFSFFCGWLIHGDPIFFHDVVIFRRRK